MYEIYNPSILCPLCDQWVTNWSHMTGRTITINGVTYHRACTVDLKVEDMEDGKWKKQKHPP